MKWPQWLTFPSLERRDVDEILTEIESYPAIVVQTSYHCPHCGREVTTLDMRTKILNSKEGTPDASKS